jgi:Na+/H+-translocating membrane pyrophosphatase
LTSLLVQALHGFNRRVGIILIQFIAISNATMMVLSRWFSSPISVDFMLSFDISLLVFFLAIYTMLIFFPNGLSRIFSIQQINKRALILHVIRVGSIQTGIFFGVFCAMIYMFLIFFNAMGMVSLASGILVLSFYYRSAGGSFKAAAENSQIVMNMSKKRVLTHPSDILIKTGTIIATVGGYYLDIFGSYSVAIAAFFGVMMYKFQGLELSDLLLFQEVQWVLMIIICTGVSMCFGFLYSLVRKNTSNIFLEMGYVAVVSLFLFVMGVTLKMGELDGYVILIGAVTGLFLMVGHAFFTNFLTSSHHSPIRYICNQAQYGGANVLISSFFNGLIANAVFVFLFVLFLIVMGNFLGLVGLMMIIIYALSIAVIACSMKVFSVISNQVSQIMEYHNTALNESNAAMLQKVSYTLVSIGNSFSSGAGVLSGLVTLIAALSVVKIQIQLTHIDFLLGLGLGIVMVAVFYAASIGGTYTTLVDSQKEVKRQCAEIPHLNEENKAHPNIHQLIDLHSVNGLSAITWPGAWIIVGVAVINLLISQTGVLGALLGMFITIFIHSFFWSIFGDSVASVYHLMRLGKYGGNQTGVFALVHEAFLYAHYFQWVLAPSGVIIMKFVGIMALLLALF